MYSELIGFDICVLMIVIYAIICMNLMYSNLSFFIVAGIVTMIILHYSWFKMLRSEYMEEVNEPLLK